MDRRSRGSLLHARTFGGNRPEDLLRPEVEVNCEYMTYNYGEVENESLNEILLFLHDDIGHANGS